jgi:L-serine/L-threonine ammonia-lyase
MERPLHIRTPLLESPAIGAASGRQILLKMECLQPTASFKIRGIGRLCEESARGGSRGFVSSSGGNAGYAAAYAGRKLGLRTTVFVPESTGASSRDLIRAQGAEVRVVGSVWDEAHEAALEFSRQSDATCVPPFDHPLIWSGNSTLVDEVLEQADPPDAVVVSVGGGGLLCGVVEGLRRHGLDAVPVVAVETEGTASLSASVAAGRLVTLERIMGIATSLGARRVCDRAFELASIHPVRSVVVTDAQAAAACLRFADDHRTLVEPACGASLSVVYRSHEALGDAKRVLVVVCGGMGASLSQVGKWREVATGSDGRRP